jgi:hypothetical protein
VRNVDRMMRIIKETSAHCIAGLVCKTSKFNKKLILLYYSYLLSSCAFEQLFRQQILHIEDGRYVSVVKKDRIAQLNLLFMDKASDHQIRVEEWRSFRILFIRVVYERDRAAGGEREREKVRENIESSLRDPIARSQPAP